MKNLFYISILLYLSSCSVLSVQNKVLYDSYEKNPKSESKQQIIYAEGLGTLWNSMFECGQFEINNSISHSGKSSIKINWNKSNCEWIGFGNSFNNWQPYDLSSQINTKALSFYIRTQEETSNSAPIVACLEDYGGGASYHYIDIKKYLVGLHVDTNWKQVIVPLWEFPINEEDIDLTSIKQVKFQLEGAGSFYIDDITLTEITQKSFNEMREKVESMKPKGQFEQKIYPIEQFDESTWGYKNNACQQLKEQKTERKNKIYWKYNSEVCDWSKWGINWNGWYAINCRGLSSQSQIKLSFTPLKKSEFSVYLEDFNGKRTLVYHHTDTSSNKKSTLFIPLSELALDKDKLKMDQIKQLRFEGNLDGEIEIDEIQIIRK